MSEKLFPAPLAFILSKNTFLSLRITDEKIGLYQKDILERQRMIEMSFTWRCKELAFGCCSRTGDKFSNSNWNFQDFVSGCYEEKILDASNFKTGIWGYNEIMGNHLFVKAITSTSKYRSSPNYSWTDLLDLSFSRCKSYLLSEGWYN